MCSFISEEDANGQEHKAGEPHAGPGRPERLTRHLIAGVVYDIIDNEHDHADYHGCSHTSLTDDCSQRCSNKEEDEACKGECELAIELHFVLSHVSLKLIEQDSVVFKLVGLCLGFIERSLHSCHFLIGLESLVQVLDLVGLHLLCFYRRQLTACLALTTEVFGVNHIRALLATALVSKHLNGVDGLDELAYVFCHMLILQNRLIISLKLGREIDHDTLHGERFPAVRDTLFGIGSLLLLLVDILKRLPIEQLEYQVFLISRKIDHTGIGHHHLSIFKALGIIINHHIVEHAGLVVFMLHIEIIPADAIIKLAFWDVHLWRFLPEREDERPEFGLRNGQDVVREEESAYTDEGNSHDEGAHNAEERDASRLHGRQFKPFAHVSEGHQRSKQYGKRKSQRYHGTERINEEFRHNRHLNTLPYEVLHVHPHKLHKQDKCANEECHQEKPKKSLEHIEVEFFQTKIHFLSKFLHEVGSLAGIRPSRLAIQRFWDKRKWQQISRRAEDKGLLSPI